MMSTHPWQQHRTAWAVCAGERRGPGTQGPEACLGRCRGQGRHASAPTDAGARAALLVHRTRAAVVRAEQPRREQSRATADAAVLAPGHPAATGRPFPQHATRRSRLHGLYRGRGATGRGAAPHGLFRGVALAVPTGDGGDQRAVASLPVLQARDRTLELQASCCGRRSLPRQGSLRARTRGQHAQPACPTPAPVRAHARSPECAARDGTRAGGVTQCSPPPRGAIAPRPPGRIRRAGTASAARSSWKRASTATPCRTSTRRFAVCAQLRMPPTLAGRPALRL